MFGLPRDTGQGGLAILEWKAETCEAEISPKFKADLLEVQRALKAKGLVYDYDDRWISKQQDSGSEILRFHKKIARRE